MDLGKIKLQSFQKIPFPPWIQEPSACHLITVHNVCHQLMLMRQIREAICADTLPGYIQKFMATIFPDKQYPQWAKNAFESVGVKLL